MVTWRREYLVEVAVLAEERVMALFDLFEVEAPSVWLTPGVVQMVLEAHAELAGRVTVKNGQSDTTTAVAGADEEGVGAPAPAEEEADAPVEELPPAEVTEPVDPVARGLEVVRSLAADGELPSMAVYNTQKPEDAPASHTLLRELGGVKWTDLAERLGLRLSARQEAMMALRAEQESAKTQEASDEENADDEPETAPTGISANAAAVLGPEHVVVTPHGSERTNGRGHGSDDAPAQRPPEAMAQRPAEPISGTYRSKMLAQAKACLRRIAVDEVMPSPEAYNAARPSFLPDAEGLMWRLNMVWDDVMVEAGLKPAEAVMAPPTLGQAQRDPMARRAMLEEVIFRLRDMAADGVLPSSKAWNDQRGELPSASDLVLLFALDTWQDMAAMAKLALPGKAGRKKG